MFHPDVKIQWLNDTVGYGLIATKLIPKGTITYVKDALEIEVSPDHYQSLPNPVKAEVEKFSYIDERGYRIVSWDFSKYVNHCCHCNTMSTGYGFEIAIRDIYPGEEVTDEYGLFNMEEPMQVACGKPNCRTRISGEDLDRYFADWDVKVQHAMTDLRQVDQPLWYLLQENIIGELNNFMSDPSVYRSVYHLKYTGLSSMEEDLV